jgi:hypothetical protein
MADRYMVIDSAAFIDCYKYNTSLSFTNNLYPPLDNFRGNLEIALLELHSQDVSVVQAASLMLSCNLIESYQYGSTVCRCIKSVQFAEIGGGGSRRDVPRRTSAPELHHKVNAPVMYYPLRRGIFENITLTMSPVFPTAAEPAVTIQRLIAVLHTRERKLIKDDKNLFMKHQP